MKIQCVHAHPDDFEFVASGTFTRFNLEKNATSLATICTDGAGGHHRHSRELTARIRRDEQEQALAIGTVGCEWLHLPDGKIPREGCIDVGRLFLAALWKSIRQFQPTYLFCPPLPADPLAGIHVDHVAVAEGVRKVAYLLNVPHAFTPEYPELETPEPHPCATPVILQTHDSYTAGANAFDLAIDVEDQFGTIARMSWAHQSQITEWLPWVGRHHMQPPSSLADWESMLRQRFLRRNREMGVSSSRIHEFFTVTAWGEVPSIDQLLLDFPGIAPDWSQLSLLENRLTRWRAD